MCVDKIGVLEGHGFGSQIDVVFFTKTLYFTVFQFPHL